MNYRSMHQFVSQCTEAHAPSPHPIRFGVAGLGGFASYVADRLLEAASSPHPIAQLIAACEPHLEKFVSRSDELKEQGVHIVGTFDELLKQDVEAIWLPIPIDLHRPFTEAALAAGKAVLCEKPAAATVEDVDAMIAARDRAGLPVLIGFQDLYQPSVNILKRRILDGEFGKPLGASVIGCWPRGERYFQRNDWAGRYARDGRWVMDSPAANALAHFLHLPLFLLGSSLHSAANPLSVGAELYRANPIENFDTCVLHLVLADQVPLIAAFTHACDEIVEPEVVLEMQKATIRYYANRHIDIERSGARRERLPLSKNPHQHMLEVFPSVHAAPGAARAVREPGDGPRPRLDRQRRLRSRCRRRCTRSIHSAHRRRRGLSSAGCSEHRAGAPGMRRTEAAAARDRLMPWSAPAAIKNVNGYACFNGPPSRARQVRPRASVSVFPPVRVANTTH
jgi:predicted dehydrogenase